MVHPTLPHPLSVLLQKSRNLSKVGKCKVCIQILCPVRMGIFSGFRSMKQTGELLLPLDGMLVHHRVTPSIKFSSTHLYIWVERGTVRVKCLAQEHNTMSPARAQTWATQSTVQGTNHQINEPSTRKEKATRGCKYQGLLLLDLYRCL